MAQEYENRPAVPSVFVTEIEENSRERVNLESFEEKTRAPEFHQLWLVPDQRPVNDESKYLEDILENEFQLSYSAMNEYVKCPHLFKVRHLLQIPEPTDDAALYGTIMHRLMENYIKLDGEIENPKYIKHMISEQVDRVLPRYPNKERWIEELDRNFQVVISKYLISTPKPEKTELSVGRYQPVVWEGVPIQGKIDRIDWINKEEKTVRIVDYKTTTAKSKNALMGLTQDKDSPSYLNQLRFYSLLLRNSSQHNYEPKEMSLVFLTPTDTKDPDIKQVTFDVEDDEALDNLKKTIHEVWDGIKRLEFEHKDGCDCER